MTDAALLTPALEAVVGRTVRRRTSFPVDASDIRKWAIAARWPDPLPDRFRSVDTATLEAPGDFNPFAWACVADSLDDVGLDIGDAGWIEKVLGVSPPPVTRQLNGAIDHEYLAPIRAGDTIHSRTVLTSYKEREGRLGTMLITTLTDSWTNQRNETVRRSAMTLIRY